MKTRLLPIIAAVAVLFAAAPALAHVTVAPDKVGISQRQNFTVSVPNEKDNPTIGLRLVIPDGLQDVSPVVKSGWTLSVKKDGDNVQELTWTGGSIPAGQTDLFVINALAPDKAATLAWKAYQTYSDGSVVSWDATPGSKPADGQELTPYSETKVVNDLSSSGLNSPQLPLYVSIAAVVIAAAALLRRH